MPALEDHDPWLTRTGLLEAGRAWADGDDLSIPRLSPVNGPLYGLPSLDIHTGTRDILHPDALTLHQRATAAGVESSVHIVSGALHVHPLLPVPEGRAARTHIRRALHRGRG
ncbi:alpha/beta hydrolase [Streptomyces viridiviolaceus]|uniref:Alpha/beta hydrolase n=1 Tax=Streptomyces viridiviolaceus TaxID=68282 RepID=A0ABW2E686_9ACTN